MTKTSLWVGICLCPLFAPCTHAEFIADSKAEITLRNFYFDRDYKKDPYPYTAARDWAQGLIFKGQSGYTEGTVGLGLMYWQWQVLTCLVIMLMITHEVVCYR
jgi:hypothetical protein